MGVLDSEFTATLFAVAILSLLVVVLVLRHVVFRRLSDRVIRDPETGVFTADFIQEVYQSELRRSERTGVPFSLAFVVPRVPMPPPEADGQAASLAKWLVQQLRASDYLGYLEDDRFIVILPETWEEDALSLVSRLTSAIKFKPEAARWLSADVGVATWRPESPDVWHGAEQQLTRFTSSAARQN